MNILEHFDEMFKTYRPINMKVLERNNVDRDVSRIKTHPSPLVSEDIVKTKSNASEAAKTRTNLISTCKNRKRGTCNYTNAKFLYTPKRYFEQSQYFSVVEAEPEVKIISSNKERKRQLNWREFSLDVLGNKISWEDIKVKENFSTSLSYQSVDFEDNVVFQVIEPVKEKRPVVLKIMGRKHVVDFNYDSETVYTSLGTFKSSFRSFLQNDHDNSSHEMETYNEKKQIVISEGAHLSKIASDDVRIQTLEKPVPLPRTIFFKNGFKQPVATPRVNFNVLQGLETIPPPQLDFDLVPEEKIFKNVLSSFNKFDPLYLTVCDKKSKLVEAARVKPDLTYAASTSHHKTDVKTISVKSKKSASLSGLFYEVKQERVGEYSYEGFDLSNPVYVYPRYIPSFHWNKNQTGNVERYAATDFNEKRQTKFDKIVKVSKTIFENMDSVFKGKKRSFQPVEKMVSFKTYIFIDDPLCKKCKGSGCIKCNYWGSPITMSPEKWFEKSCPLDNSFSPKMTALKVASSKVDEAKEL